MSQKIDSSLLQEDLYNILEISIDADEKQIRKSFRKKALVCHPDKNPDDPNAAEQFNRLKKVLEILLDPGARRAYDKVLKARKEAAIRAREADHKTQKLKSDLEEREKTARLRQDVKHPSLSEEERLRREIKRLEEEGEQLIAEELEKLNKEAGFSKKEDKDQPSQFLNENRVKVKWKQTEEDEGYTKAELEKLFFKWGEINAIVMKKKESKMTAIIEFKTESGASLASQFEKGLIGKPLEVSRCFKTEKKDKKDKNKDTSKSARDFESLAQMNWRREAERRKLIEEMAKNNDC